MSKVLTDQVLVLNKNWQAIEVTDVATAFANMTRGVHTALDTDQMTPVRLADWMKLPVRANDKSIGTVHGPVRVPTVIIAVRYDKVHKKRPKLNNRGIKERDGARCQVTGDYCPNNGSVDHVHAKSRGGEKKSWRNQVWMRKDLNHKKGSRTLEEMGWKLLREPKEPVEVPVTLTIRPRPDKPDWNHFLIL